MAQVSRWDHLKDPVGVLRGFVDHVDGVADAHLLLVGPTVDAMVNAIQRHAAVVVQKSLAEGFGLTVAEALWKGRPVVASAVGGIQDQVADGVDGLLVAPTNSAEFGRAVSRLLDDPELAARLGRAAHERVRAAYLEPRHLSQWVAVIEALPAWSGPRDRCCSERARAVRFRSPPARVSSIYGCRPDCALGRSSSCTRRGRRRDDPGVLRRLG